MNFEEFQSRVHKNSYSHGFWDDLENKNIPTKLMLIVTEIGEAMEEFRSHPIHETRYTDEGKPEGFTSELADAVIRIMDLSEYIGLPLSRVMEEKHEYNKTRPHKHGKRV